MLFRLTYTTIYLFFISFLIKILVNLNFFNTIRGKTTLNAPIDDASISMAMVHYANIAYRINKGFAVDEKSGRIYDREAMNLWSRSYEPGWELDV